MLTRAASVWTYLSSSCRMGAHGKCDESESKTPGQSRLVVYETCVCVCHQNPHQRIDRREVD